MRILFSLASMRSFSTLSKSRMMIVKTTSRPWILVFKIATKIMK